MGSNCPVASHLGKGHRACQARAEGVCHGQAAAVESSSVGEGCRVCPQTMLPESAPLPLSSYRSPLYSWPDRSQSTWGAFMGSVPSNTRWLRSLSPQPLCSQLGRREQKHTMSPLALFLECLRIPSHSGSRWECLSLPSNHLPSFRRQPYGLLFC